MRHQVRRPRRYPLIDGHGGSFGQESRTVESADKGIEPQGPPANAAADGQEPSTKDGAEEGNGGHRGVSKFVPVPNRRPMKRAGKAIRPIRSMPSNDPAKMAAMIRSTIWPALES